MAKLTEMSLNKREWNEDLKAHVLVFFPHSITKRGNVTTQRWTCEDWTTVDPWHCRRCKAEYDRSHNRKYYRRETWELYTEYSARTGYCEECVKAESEKLNKWFRSYAQQSQIIHEVHTHNGQIKEGCELVDIYPDGTRVVYGAAKPREE